MDGVNDVLPPAEMGAVVTWTEIRFGGLVGKIAPALHEHCHAKR